MPGQQGCQLSVSCPSPSLSLYSVRPTEHPSLLIDVLALAIVIFSFYTWGSWKWLGLGTAAVWVKWKTSTVLEESILAIRLVGLQLSTTRGISFAVPIFLRPLLPSFLAKAPALSIPITTSHLFLPLSSISDIVVNEGIFGWTIIYYLVVIQDGNTEGEGQVKLRVGFPELLPRVATLRKVWQGLRHVLFDEMGEDEVGTADI